MRKIALNKNIKIILLLISVLFLSLRFLVINNDIKIISYLNVLLVPKPINIIFKFTETIKKNTTSVLTLQFELV